MKKSTPHTSIYSESVFAVLCVLNMILMTMVLPCMSITDAEMIYVIIAILILGLVTFIMANLAVLRRQAMLTEFVPEVNQYDETNKPTQ